MDVHVSRRNDRNEAGGCVLNFTNVAKLVTPNGEVQSIYNGSTLVWERNLPNDYEELEYISASNNQYFFVDNFYLNSTSEVEAVVYFSGNAGNTYGCYTGSSASDNFCFYGGSSSSDAYLRYNGELVRAFKATANTKYTLIHSASGFYVNGTKVGTFSSATFTCSHSFGVGQLYSSTAAKFSGRIYSIVVRENGSETLNLVPVKKLSTTTAGMYDTVGQTFYSSSGSNQFVAGPNKY